MLQVLHFVFIKSLIIVVHLSVLHQRTKPELAESRIKLRASKILFKIYWLVCRL
jgi:hypothetical protein